MISGDKRRIIAEQYLGGENLREDELADPEKAATEIWDCTDDHVDWIDGVAIMWQDLVDYIKEKAEEVN